MRGCGNCHPQLLSSPRVQELLRRIAIFQTVTGRTPRPEDEGDRDLELRLLQRDHTVDWRSWIRMAVGREEGS